MREFAADLGLGDDQTYDLKAFAKWVGGKQGKQIILVPCSMPQAMPSLWIEYESEHCVLFEASLPSQEKTHTVLKELSHILLGHAPLIKTGGDYRVSAIGTSDAGEAPLASARTLPRRRPAAKAGKPCGKRSSHIPCRFPLIFLLSCVTLSRSTE